MIDTFDFETPTDVRTVVICVPPLVNMLSPNGGHKNRFAKAKAIKIARNDGFVCALKEIGVGKPFMQKAVVSVKWYQPRSPIYYAPRDTQNAIAALKHTIDGIVGDAGLLPSDAERYLSWGKVEVIRTAKECDGRNEIELTFTEQTIAEIYSRKRGKK